MRPPLPPLVHLGVDTAAKMSLCATPGYRKSKNETTKSFFIMRELFPQEKSSWKKIMWKWSGLLCLHKFALSISHWSRLMSNCLWLHSSPLLYIYEKYMCVWCVYTIRLSAGVFSACFHSATQSPAIQRTEMEREREREHVEGLSRPK